MNKYSVLLIALIVFGNLSRAQQKTSDDKKDGYEKQLGSYLPEIDSLLKFNIKKENGKLIVEIEGQGQTSLSRIAINRFKAKGVRPETIVEFVPDSVGNIQKMLWMQTIPKFEWKRIDTPATNVNNRLGVYEGQYKLENNAYQVITVKNENGHLTAQTSGESKHELTELSNDSFKFEVKDFSLIYEFVRNKSGAIEKILTIRKGPITFIKISGPAKQFAKHEFGSKTGFTAADTLRGMLTPSRTSYDVLFYNLDVTVDPGRKSVRGSNIIRFKAIQSFDKIQVDLFANMKIEKILFHNQALSFDREFDAVFVKFPNSIQQGSVDEIEIYYSGTPQLPDISTLRGGFLWFQDKNGKPWIESVCQGSGASLWWPCKDHLSDKPDSMKISITVPSPMVEISNGKLLSKKNIANNLTRYEWYVSYPITNYNVVVNIGDYEHFSDFYISNTDTIAINYYSISYNIDKAKQIFKHVQAMLRLYEKDFGPYPFMKDGITLIESLYPMEHQSAVSIGPINNPINSDNYDSLELIRTMWHETGHEWWGNSITCKDMADLWIHEAFATYAEVLNYETTQGKEAALKYIKSESPKNEDPIIGKYDVNDFRLGDMYTKGALMLHTLRSILDNDSLFFSILKGIQRDLKYQTVTTENIVAYINKATNTDFGYFFDQYLRYASIPELQIRIKKNQTSLDLQYKWNANVDGFHMPVKISVGKNMFDFIYPNTSWQTMQLKNLDAKDFKIDTDGFYIKVKK